MLERVAQKLSMDIGTLVATIVNGSIMALAVGGAFHAALSG